MDVPEKLLSILYVSCNDDIYYLGELETETRLMCRFQLILPSMRKNQNFRDKGSKIIDLSMKNNEWYKRIL